MKYTKQDISQAIGRYLDSFEKVLYEEDSQFLEGMKTKSEVICCSPPSLVRGKSL